ncbi:MAG: ATP-dependent 6-phosphofructokinase [Candidatus Schekmanbacteria bacterium]|nr:ATP-dependent 6-phosphofructokinase [Candidatus Schekmanbacteria bacterium]
MPDPRSIRRIAINTGGGDAPGLNAVIRAVVLSACRIGWEVYGIRRSYDGLFEADGVTQLVPARVQGITHVGGTILGTTNQGNPFKYPVTGPDGKTRLVDRSAEILTTLRDRRVDALVAIGGDGSLSIAYELFLRGLPVIGVPKTIDNDLDATVLTFGFDTAVQTATEAIDKLQSTAEAHRRVMVVEVMGRYAGWIALHSGLAAAADIILLPEIPFKIDKVIEKIREREEHGQPYAIVVAAEGARPYGGDFVTRGGSELGREIRLGGIADLVARQIEQLTGKETRSLVLGHLQRGGNPTTFDRLMALRFGAAAVRYLRRGAYGRMVALRPPDVLTVPLRQAISQRKLVPMDSDTILTARSLGTCLGD